MHVQIEKRRKTDQCCQEHQVNHCSQHTTTKGHDKFGVSDIFTVQTPGQNK